MVQHLSIRENTISLAIAILLSIAVLITAAMIPSQEVQAQPAQDTYLFTEENSSGELYILDYSLSQSDCINAVRLKGIATIPSSSTYSCELTNEGLVS